MNQKKVGKFWYFLFVVFLIVDLYYLNYFYNKKHHYLINFDIRPSLMVIYLFLFVCLLFLSNLKSNKLQIALVILTFLQSLSYYSIQKKNYLGSDFASFKKAETCLNTIYPKNQSIRIIATGESDRNSRTQLRNYNNLFKYLLDYSNETIKTICLNTASFQIKMFQILILKILIINLITEKIEINFHQVFIL